MFDARQMHRAAFAVKKPAFAPHKLTENAGHRGTARQRMVVPPIGAKGVIVVLHGAGKARRHGFLAEAQVAGAFDQVLEKQVVRALLHVAAFELQPPELEPFGLADVVIRQVPRRRFLDRFLRQSALPQLNLSSVLAGSFRQA